MTSDQFAKDLLTEANAHLKNDSGKKELERSRQRIYGLASQLEALAEKIANLPSDVPPEPLYRQMAKINDLKILEEQRLPELKAACRSQNEIADFQDYKAIQQLIKDFVTSDTDPESLRTVIRRLIHRIEIGPDFMEIKYIVAKADLNLARIDFATQGQGSPEARSQKNLSVGSQSLTIGARGGT